MFDSFQHDTRALSFLNAEARHNRRARASIAKKRPVNKEFFFDFQIDESDHIKNILLANASCSQRVQN
jgi:hypothetical protein